jgi:hypothetical protein
LDLFTDDSRSTFRRSLVVDGATWACARGWALWEALITLVHAQHGGPDADILGHTRTPALSELLGDDPASIPRTVRVDVCRRVPDYPTDQVLRGRDDTPWYVLDQLRPPEKWNVTKLPSAPDASSSPPTRPMVAIPAPGISVAH